MIEKPQKLPEPPQVKAASSQVTKLAFWSPENGGKSNRAMLCPKNINIPWPNFILIEGTELSTKPSVFITGCDNRTGDEIVFSTQVMWTHPKGKYIMCFATLIRQPGGCESTPSQGPPPEPDTGSATITVTGNGPPPPVYNEAGIEYEPEP